MTQQVLGDLEGLKAQILAQAQHRSDEILAAAKAQVQEILAQAKEKADQKTAQILAQAQIKAKQQQRQLQIAAQLEERKQMLAAKRALLEQAFARALASFAQLPREEYQQFILALLTESQDQACRKLVIAAGEERITPEFLSRLSEDLNWQLELVTEDNPRLAKGGFLLRGEKLEIDCTIPTLLELDRAQLEGEVAKILFGDL